MIGKIRSCSEAGDNSEALRLGFLVESWMYWSMMLNKKSFEDFSSKLFEFIAATIS
jgi:hypothetical protein